MSIVIAAISGLMAGVFLTALIVSGKRADARMEQMQERSDNQGKQH